MSDDKPILYANFINRRNKSAKTGIPVQNRITLNQDLRNLTDSFDFEIDYKVADKVDLASHDFVEFYFLLNGQKFQVGCGFIEDFVKETSASTHKFQANGRDFLGQLFNLPFLIAKPVDVSSIVNFTKSCVADAYLTEYLGINGRTQTVVDSGSFPGPVIIPQLTDAKRAPVLQQTADELYNIIYQDRLGRAVVWGRGNGGSNLDRVGPGLTLNETGDVNVQRMVLRQNFSRVYSEVKVLYTGGYSNVDYALQTSQNAFNSELKARQIFQPEVRTFQASTLVQTSTSNVDVVAKMDQLAASILRKSNQNLFQVVVSTNRPYFLAKNGSKIAYEKNQVWTINKPSDQFSEKMRLAGIGYTQDASNLSVELMFIGLDTLI